MKRKFTEASYIVENAGIENVSYLNASGTYNSSSLDLFLTSYEGQQIHLLTEIPLDLADDVLLPKPMMCGNFASSLAEVVLSMNGGNVTMGLNRESLDGLHCNLQGTQSIVLIDRLQHEFAKEGVSLSLERRSIDLCWYRSLQKLKWHNVTLEEGDCIYIPSKWYKEINFVGNRNLGVNFRFFRLLYFNQSDCQDEPSSKLPRFQSQDDLLKFEIISLSENHASLDWDTFQNLYHMPGINDEKSLKKLYEMLDQDGDNEVLPEDMYSLRTSDFLRFFQDFKSKDTQRQRKPVANNSSSNLSVEKEL